MNHNYGVNAKKIKKNIQIQKVVGNVTIGVNPENTPKPIDINWREVCQNALAERQRLTTNPLTTGDGLEFTFDDIYVPLGLVEKVKKEKRPGEVSPEEGSQFYQPEKEYEEVTRTYKEEVTRTYKNDEFFAQVLKQRQSPKSQGRRLAVTGEPGAGKTTLLQKIAQWVAAETERDVAIWVSLADLQGRNVEDYLLQKWLKDALGAVRVTPEMEEALELLFKSGRVWLLLDGVDEMGSDNPLATVANQIRGWVASARVVVTCRQNVWDAGKNALEGFDVYRNLDFDYPEGVGQFIHGWFARHPELGERLLAELAQAGKERIRDTVRNPLRLALLCRAWQIRQGGLPETKAGLYGQFAEALYEWKQEAFPTKSKQRKDLNAGLGRLALRGMEQSESRFRLREGLVTEILGETDEPLCKLALDLGWLNLVGVAEENPDERVYAFYHPTFQEYFAALAVDDWGYFLPRNHMTRSGAFNAFKNKYYRIFEKQWKEVILLWLGRNDLLDEEKDEFINKLVYFNDGTLYNLYGFHAIFLAAVGINEFKKCKLSDGIVFILRDFALDRFGFHNNRLPFGGKLENMDIYWSNMKISSMARKFLLHTIKEKVIATLVEVIVKNTNVDICSKALEILKDIPLNNQIDITTLLELLRNTEDTTTRYGVVKCLAKIECRNEKVVTALTNMLETTEEAENRWILAHSLAEIDSGNEIAIKELIWNNYTWEDFFKRGFDKINDSERPIITTHHKVAIRELTKLLEVTKDKKIIPEIAKFLGIIDPGNQLAIDSLTTLLETDFDKEKDDISYLLNAKFLGIIDPGNQLAIDSLTNLLNHRTRYAIFASGYLDEIDPGNQLAGQLLIELFKSLKSLTDEKISTDFDDFFTQFLNEVYLKFSLIDDKIDDKFIMNDVYVTLERLSTTNKLLVIDVLIKKLEINKNNGMICYYISYLLLDPLSEVTYGNQQVIEVLTRLIATTKGLFNKMSLAFCLGKIDTNNRLAIKTLIDLLETIQHKKYHNTKYHKVFWFCLMISDILLEINPGNKQALNEMFWNYELIRCTQNKENNNSFSTSSEIIWKTSQIVSYPYFFQIYFYSGSLFAIYIIKELAVEIIYDVILHNFYNFANAVITTLKKWLRIFLNK